MNLVRVSGNGNILDAMDVVFDMLRVLSARCGLGLELIPGIAVNDDLIATAHTADGLIFGPTGTHDFKNEAGARSSCRSSFASSWTFSRTSSRSAPTTAHPRASETSASLSRAVKQKSCTPTVMLSREATKC